MGPCVKIFKFFVFLFNFVFFFGGVFIIAAGCYLAIKLKHYFDFFATSDLALGIDLSPYILIVLGILVTIISFLGCCGACTNNGCMMCSFGALMAIVVIIQITIAVFLLTYKQEAIDNVYKAMDEGMKKYQTSGFEGVTQVWDNIQRNLQCCGAINSTDWNGKPFQSNPNNAPDTCCTQEYTGCGQGLLDPSYEDRVIFRHVDQAKNLPDKRLHEIGCLIVIDSYVEDRKIIVFTAGTMIILVQVVAFIGSIFLAKKMRDEENAMPPFYE